MDIADFMQRGQMERIFVEQMWKVLGFHESASINFQALDHGSLIGSRSPPPLSSPRGNFRDFLTDEIKRTPFERCFTSDYVIDVSDKPSV